MFSKPIMIAASVAATNATLMAKGSDNIGTTRFSEITGCGKCMKFADTHTAPGGYIMGNAATSATSYFYGTLTAWVTTAVSGNSITGDACCKDATTKEASADSATFCAKAAVAYDATDKKHNNIILATNDFFQSALAKCPHNTTNCTYAGKKKDTTTAITVTAANQRFINIEDQGSVVTLKMIGLISTGAGTAPSMTQKIGDVCTWIIATKCDAPVITVGATSAALTLTGLEWSIQVLEWDEEFLSSDTWLATAYTGPDVSKYYPPLATEMVTSKKIADLDAENTDKTAPNNLMGDVSFKVPVTTGVVYNAVPGNTLVAWMANIKAVYDSYSAEVVKYDAERVIWDKYAKYEAPAPGLFDWLFGATEDPDKPAAASSPLAPTQPVAVPATIKSLGLSDTSATKSPSMAEYKDKKGYGYPSAYTLVPVKSNTVKPFGTLAGGGVAKDIATAATAADSLMSVRKTANYDATGATAITTCKKSYLMITAVWNDATAAKTVEMIITTSAWANTLE